MSWGLLANRGDRTIDRKNKQCEPGGGKSLGHVRGRQTLPVKGHIVNISGFMAQMVSVSTVVAL